MDRCIEGGLVGARRFAISADFADELQGRLVDLLLAGGVIGETQGLAEYCVITAYCVVSVQRTAKRYAEQ